MKTIRAWAIVDKTGSIEDHQWRYRTYPLRRHAKLNLFEGERIVRVEIRELTRKRKRPQ